MLHNGTKFVDYDMYFPCELLPNQIGYVKVTKTNTSQAQNAQFDRSLQQRGFANSAHSNDSGGLIFLNESC